MGSGCGNIIVDIHPSSSGQLPVPVALDATLPTLFIHTIHHVGKNVNPQFSIDHWKDGIAGLLVLFLPGQEKYG